MVKRRGARGGETHVQMIGLAREPLHPILHCKFPQNNLEFVQTAGGRAHVDLADSNMQKHQVCMQLINLIPELNLFWKYPVVRFPADQYAFAAGSVNP